MAKSSRVTSIPINSVNSGAKLLDFVKVPEGIFIAWLTLRGVLRHWFLTGISIIALTGRWWLVTVLVLLPFIVCYSYVQLTNRAHAPLTVLKAMKRLSFTRKRWSNAVITSGGLNKGPYPPKMIGFLPTKRGWRPPKIMDPQATSLAFHLDMSGTNATYHDLDNNRERVADDLRARRCRVKKTVPGYCELIIEWGSVDLVKKLTNHAVELDENFYIELSTSLLVVGESNSGKSNLVWNVLNNLNKLDLPYNMHVLDPKRVELADLRNSPHLIRYTHEISKFEAVVKDFRAQMEKTFDEMESIGIRKVEISDEFPLNLLIIDEFLSLPKHMKTADSDLGIVLSQGRAAGFVVIGCSQLSQIDAVDRVRDLFPQRACLATKSSDITNAVLGPKAEERGARCSEITQPGVGFMYTDATGTFQKFRPPFIPDGPHGIGQVASGAVWEAPEQPNPHTRSKGAYTYILWGQNVTASDIEAAHRSEGNQVVKRPLYVGKAINPSKRMKQHESTQPWWPNVNHGLTQISEKYPTEEDALREETELIEKLRPIYNLAGRNYHN